MWSRKDLKEQGQKRFVKNYWRAVLAGLILALAIGKTVDITGHYDYNDAEEYLVDTEYNIDSEELSEVEEVVEEAIEDVIDRVSPFAGLITFVVLIATSAGIIVKFFVFNPLEVGGRNFFVKNLDEEAQIPSIGAGFNQQYIFTVKTMFLRDLYTFLWSLLLVVPGIVKAYEYRMIPYLLAENPELTTSEAFEISKRMMDGNKWDTFILDLSFIGWHILSGITAGIVGVFYVYPYQFSTNALLYRVLSNATPIKPETDFADYANYEEIE